MRAAVFIIGAALLCGRPAAAAEPIVLVTSLEQQTSAAARWLNLIYIEAFRQLDVPLQVRLMPAARAGAEAIAGNVDGEMARGYNYQSMQRTMLRVAEPVVWITTAAYTRDGAIHLTNGWESLRGTGYSVGYRMGYPVIQQQLEAVVPSASLSSALNAQTGLRKLAAGRTALYVDTAEVVDPMLQDAEFAGKGLHMAGVLEHSAIYAYLNKRHDKLASRLSAVFRKMRDSGQIERLRQQAFKS